MSKPEKTDTQRVYGLPNFLVPSEVLPEGVNIKKLGTYVSLSCTGAIVEIEGQRFVRVDRWKML